MRDDQKDKPHVFSNCFLKIVFVDLIDTILYIPVDQLSVILGGVNASTSILLGVNVFCSST